MDGKFIKDLEDIPEGCQIILVSENAPPKEQLNRLSVAAEAECVSDLENSKILSASSSAERLAEQSQHQIKGLKNNVFQIDNQTDYMKQKVRQLEDSIQDKKHQWLERNLDKWNKSTPHIYDYHKQADKKLHSIS